MKYPIAYLHPIFLSTSAKALLSFFVLTPSIIFLYYIGILNIKETIIVKGIVPIKLPRHIIALQNKVISVKSIISPVIIRPQLISNIIAMLKYITVNLTCRGAILLVLANNPNQKLFFNSSQKNFILVLDIYGLTFKVLLYNLLALSHGVPTLPNTFFLALIL